LTGREPIWISAVLFKEKEAKRVSSGDEAKKPARPDKPQVRVTIVEAATLINEARTDGLRVALKIAPRRRPPMQKKDEPSS
jgi:hypothetical protein